VNAENYLLAVIGGMTLATFATRALPFLLLRSGDHPLVLFLGRNLPPAVMTLLVLYSVRHVPELGLAASATYALAIAATALLHIWRRNVLLSIGAGTSIFMLLQRGV
jgi:branched-subunit amino acid transport protein AzlD